MLENAAQRYIRADLSPQTIHEVIWKAAPLPFKLYPNCEQIRCGYESVRTQTGEKRTGAVGIVPNASSAADKGKPYPACVPCATDLHRVGARHRTEASPSRPTKFLVKL